MSDKTRSQAYWDGYRAEGARQAAKDRARAVFDAHPNIADLAHEVAKSLARDNGRKQKLFARSPGIFAGMDAEELGRMSSRELAERELKELGIDAGDNDPEALLDAHYAGRQFARDGNRAPGSGDNRLIGGAHDVFEGAAVDKWLADLEGRHSARDSAATSGAAKIDAYINPKE